MKNIPVISQAVVIGDRRKFLSALLTVDEAEAQKWASENNASVESLSTNDDFYAQLSEKIQSEVNSRFAKVEHIRKFKVLPRELSIDEGELTPTLKIKR